MKAARPAAVLQFRPSGVVAGLALDQLCLFYRRWLGSARRAWRLAQGPRQLPALRPARPPPSRFLARPPLRQKRFAGPCKICRPLLQRFLRALLDLPHHPQQDELSLAAWRLRKETESLWESWAVPLPQDVAPPASLASAPVQEAAKRWGKAQSAAQSISRNGAGGAPEATMRTMARPAH